MVPKTGILVAKPFVFKAGDRYVRKLFAVLEHYLESFLIAKVEQLWREALRERDSRTRWPNGKRVFFTMI
jgi:hypothetical protein